jgi:hypothetical protein
MRQLALFPLLAIALSGCAIFRQDAAADRPLSATGEAEASAATENTRVTSTAALGANALSAEALDTTTETEKTAALAAPATGGERELGKAVVALGPPAEQGIWLSTTLVTEKTQGRIMTAAGKSLTLELRPGTGGALLSLAAFQALGLSLTELPEVTIFGQ